MNSSFDNHLTETCAYTSDDLSETSKYISEEERLNSFEAWPVAFLNPSIMARAGFYYIKRSDIVQCPFCTVQVGCWTPGDDPATDHRKYSPSCEFVRKKQLGYDTSERVEEEEEEEEDIKIEDKSLNIPIHNLSLNDDDDHLPIHKVKAPLFPNYANLAARLETYASWPTGLAVRPQPLSEGGFFYTGRGDETICFYCGGGLKDWQSEDSPWVEHARWFSKCHYVSLVKGKDFVDQVCCNNIVKAKSNRKEGVSGTIQKGEIEEVIRKEGVSGTVQKGEIEEVIQNQNSKGIIKTDHSNICKICYTNDMAIVFLPCGHLVACVDCALSLTTCAICREVINATVRVFLC